MVQDVVIKFEYVQRPVREANELFAALAVVFVRLPFTLRRETFILGADRGIEADELS